MRSVENASLLDKNSSSSARTNAIPTVILLLFFAGFLLTREINSATEMPQESPVSGVKRQMLYFNEEKFMHRFNQARAAIEISRPGGTWNTKPEAVLFTDLLPMLQSYEIKPDTDEMIIFGGEEHVGDLVSKAEFQEFGGRDLIWGAVRRVLKLMKPGGRLILQVCNTNQQGLVTYLEQTEGVNPGVILEFSSDWSFFSTVGIFDYDGPIQPNALMMKLQRADKEAVRTLVPLGQAFTFNGDAEAKSRFEMLLVQRYNLGGTGIFAGTCTLKLKPRKYLLFASKRPSQSPTPALKLLSLSDGGPSEPII